MRISDWSSDVCSSDLPRLPDLHADPVVGQGAARKGAAQDAPRLCRLCPAHLGIPAMAAKDQGLGAPETAADVSALGDAPRIRAILTAAAREGRSVSYSELLGDLGFRFTRPKMRAVCRTLEEVDRLAALEDRKSTRLNSSP